MSTETISQPARAEEIPAAAAARRYLERFAAPRAGAAAPAWLRARREQAMDRFAARGFPSQRQEGWRHTSLAPIVQTEFSFAEAAAPPAPALLRQLERLPLAGLGCPRAVLLNGRFAPEWSRLEGLPAGLRVTPLAHAWREVSAAEAHWARLATSERHGLIALNTALAEDGLLIEAAPDADLREPLLVIYASAASRPLAQFPRALVLAGRGARLALIELFVTLDGEGHFTDAATEIRLDENAEVDHYKIAHESLSALHFGAIEARLERDARYRTTSVLLGGRLTRNETGACLAGAGADSRLLGLYAAAGRQHMDNFTRLDHAHPHGSSREYYKGILDGESAGVFSGRIIVRPGAQRTDAIQSNKNLLLSESASLRAAEPQLEIYADDVRCTHGATVGQLDPEALFYLRTRGLEADAARRLLTYAFANEILTQIEIPRLRQALENELFARWTGTAAGAQANAPA